MKIDSRDLWAKISVSSRNDCLPENHRRFRRSHPEVIIRKGVLKKCGKFTGGHPCPSVISIKLLCNFHCVKSDQNTEFFLVCIFPHSDWIKCGKIRTRKNSLFGHFSRSVYWNRTSARVVSCKFAAYFQNTFS